MGNRAKLKDFYRLYIKCFEPHVFTLHAGSDNL